MERKRLGVRLVSGNLVQFLDHVLGFLSSNYGHDVESDLSKHQLLKLPIHTLRRCWQRLFWYHCCVADRPNIGIGLSIGHYNIQVVVCDDAVREWFVLRNWVLRLSTHLPVFSCFVTAEVPATTGFGDNPVLQTRMPNGTMLGKLGCSRYITRENRTFSDLFDNHFALRKMDT